MKFKPEARKLSVHSKVYERSIRKEDFDSSWLTKNEEIIIPINLNGVNYNPLILIVVHKTRIVLRILFQRDKWKRF